MIKTVVEFILLFSEIYVMALVFFLAYIIGSIPTGYLIVKAKTGRDIRKIGSGSTGATNVKRVMGTKWFIIVMVLDALKGFLPVFIVATFITPFQHLAILSVISAIGVIFGHSKPLFLKFKGGKSVATGVGTIIALNWQVGLIVALIWGTITFVSKYVSLGSIIAVFCSPVLMYLFHKPKSFIIYCIGMAIYITILHKDNIARLILNQENKVR